MSHSHRDSHIPPFPSHAWLLPLSTFPTRMVLFLQLIILHWHIIITQNSVLYKDSDWCYKFYGLGKRYNDIYPAKGWEDICPDLLYLLRECNGHSKHPLPIAQERTLHMDTTRGSTLKSDWLYSLHPKWRSSILSAKTIPEPGCGSDNESLL